MGRVRCAVVGCGVIGPVHGAVLQSLDTAELVACVDIDAKRAKAFAEKFGASAWYTDYRDVLERDDIDSVTICTPHYLHSDMVVAAAERGKHVLVEKPMAIDSAGATRAIDACRSAGVKLAVCFQNRLNPATVALKGAIDKGLLGDIVCISGQVSWYRDDSYYSDSQWRGRWATEGGGVLINQAIHTLDLLIHFAGDISSVSAVTATKNHDIEVEDVASMSFEFASGAVGNFFATTCSYPGSDIRVEVNGTKGSALIEGEKLVRFTTMSGDTITVTEEHGGVGAAVGKAYYGSSHGILISDYIDSILADRTPVVPGEEGRKAIDTLEAIYRSSRSGEKVVVRG